MKSTAEDGTLFQEENQDDTTNLELDAVLAPDQGTDDADLTEKLFHEIENQMMEIYGKTSKVLHEDMIKPRFDAKVALTTRGWSWEIEIKDCQDESTARMMMETARGIVQEEMDRIEAEAE